MNKTDIEWCDYTWNPITGCKRACHYCYARRIHERFYKTPFSDIVVHPERLREKMPKEPSKIFVGSMSDCEYWSKEQWELVLDVVRANPVHTFMFLTKDSWAYNKVKYWPKDWPTNCMQGLTITGGGNQAEYSHQIDRVIALTEFPRPFLSIEPLLGCLGIGKGYYKTYPELVIVGAMTGPGATPPKPEWIQSVRDSCLEDKIFWKSNIKKYL